MKGITITQELKNANIKLFGNNAVGGIIKIRLPKSFYSLNYEKGKRTDGYHTLSNTIHESDGFFDVITPVFDVATQKLGVIFFDVDKFTYIIVALTQQEKDDYQQNQVDNDASSNTNLSHKDKGVMAFDRIYATIQRNFDSGNLTKAQAKGLMENLYDSLEPLYKGQWRLAKLRCDALTPPTNAKLLTIFNNIKSKINNYITNNY